MDENRKNSYIGRAAAKCNLSLAVVAKKDKMHELDMIFCPLDAYADEARLTPTSQGGLILKEVRALFDGFDFPRFSAFFAPTLQKISSRFNVSGELSLIKGVPLGAGLGGSSACAVAAIKAVEAYLADSGAPVRPDADFLLSLGSDVPAMYVGGLCRVRGTGELVTPLFANHMPKIEVFIAPGGSDTAACYAMYDKLVEEGETNAVLARSLASRQDTDGYFKDSMTPPLPSTVQEAIAVLRNDLTLPAELLNPAIAELRARLERDNKRVIMSGSGSALCAIELAPSAR